MSRNEICSTLRYYDRLEWTNRVDVIDRDRFSSPALVRQLVAAARCYPTLVLDGTGRPDQLAAIAIGRLRRPPRVIITDATWKRGRGLLDWAANTLGMRAIRGPQVTFCVLSNWERERFSSTWGVLAAQVRFTPFCLTTPESELGLPVDDDGGVFAGGDSLRDYGPLLEAAHSIDAPVTIASRRLDSNAGTAPNLRVGQVSPERFAELNRAATVVVVPLEANTDRSAGQQTYLNAMALGKPVVVTDAPGVRDYVEDRETGLIVPPADPAAMAAAIGWLLDPANEQEVERMRSRARDAVFSRFTRSHYIASIFDIVDERASQPTPFSSG